VPRGDRRGNGASGIPRDATEMKILIVDDSRAMRRIVSRLIREAGYEDHEVMEAENGREALELVHSEFPDLILADWRMPEMTGIELLSTLNDQGYKIPFGYVTSDPTKAMVREAREAGAVFLLAKPFTAEDMARVISIVIPA
jgi:two-component system chemotaxis response regulator CheY